ncbi:hypothetical protein [Paenibacillus odorifer]|uniref:hypothetical protein n=1 Tax=Paenibacillus odorifer TaxID=189426 RepID=UPI00096D9FB2|nr:hypothetical protein [Paenibacillus odorifer]OME59479.1 hypothetical protein BSK61_06010 [Paenibacillus odorifer]
MYRVIRKFKDLKHDEYVYQIGDMYPKEGIDVSKARLKELSTTKNKYKKIYIEEIADTTDDKG